MAKTGGERFRVLSDNQASDLGYSWIDQPAKRPETKGDFVSHKRQGGERIASRRRPKSTIFGLII